MWRPTGLGLPVRMDESMSVATEETAGVFSPLVRARSGTRVHADGMMSAASGLASLS
ncbi:MAG: hypothetical protein K0S82_987 [Gaiellaceae bacterium]|jgi:hypothetical protein|nr:hypothetical protein [Gaiellaceae bacterium]